MTTLARCIALLSLIVGTLGCARPDRPVSIPGTADEGTSQLPVLVVLSAASVQTLADGSTRPTGFFLNEFYEVKRGLDEAGVSYALATVGGAAPALDPESLQEKYWTERPEGLAEATAWFESAEEVRAPLDLSDVALRPEAFSGVVVPGGQGVMGDLLHDEDLHTLLIELGTAGRPVGLVCHAPAVLSELPANRSPFRGRRVTSVSGLEEVYIERVVMGAKATNRRIGRQLRRAGLKHRSAFPGRAHAVRDGNLVTSQNPFSGEAFVELYVGALAEAKG